MAPDAGGPRSRDGADPHVPLTTQLLPVGEGHEIYLETVGDPRGIAAVYLHGGPGSGCQPDHRRLFDPQRFHTALFDQRGAGRSRPRGHREANTLDHLVADMELIRTTLDFERWLIVGGSWGATLALAYAQRHPERVSGIVLRATFLGTRAELEQAFLKTLPVVYPGLYEDFLSVLPADERDRVLDCYWRRILDPDPEVHRPAARAWHDTERILSEHRPATARLDMTSLMNSSGSLPATPFMEAHYFRNACFLKDGQLLAGATHLNGIPGIIVQGRYDLLCPPSTAHALARVWPEAELRIVEGAGHSLYNAGIKEAVITSIADLASLAR